MTELLPRSPTILQYPHTTNHKHHSKETNIIQNNQVHRIHVLYHDKRSCCTKGDYYNTILKTVIRTRNCMSFDYVDSNKPEFILKLKGRLIKKQVQGRGFLCQSSLPYILCTSTMRPNLWEKNTTREILQGLIQKTLDLDHALYWFQLNISSSISLYGT